MPRKGGAIVSPLCGACRYFPNFSFRHMPPIAGLARHTSTPRSFPVSFPANVRKLSESFGHAEHRVSFRTGVPSTLPSTFEYNSKKVSLVDDPFRSLAGFIRKIEKTTCPSSNKYCMRGYDRQCTSAGTRRSAARLAFARSAIQLRVGHASYRGC